MITYRLLHVEFVKTHICLIFSHLGIAPAFNLYFVF